MKNSELFLSKFKDLENALSANGYGTVLDYENNVMQNIDKEHLKMCRIARNHIVHSDADFFEPSKKMISFIETLTKSVESEGGIAKDIMISFAKFGCVKPTDTLDAALAIIGKKNLSNIAILSDDGMQCCLVPVPTVCKAVSEATSYKKVKMQTVFNNHIECVTVMIDTPVKQLPDEPILLVVDAKGKYRGIIINN